jgi:HK97 family phage prohead protease
MNKPERRSVQGVELRAVGDGLPVIEGYAAVFNSLSQNLGGFRERIEPGAFAVSLHAGADVRALVDHDSAKILGRNKSGTLTVVEDEHGLKVSIQPPDTSVGRDTVESIRRGDLDAMSFGFVARDDEVRKENGETIRVLRAVDLFDVSVVAYPAYLDTSVALRSIEAAKAREEGCELATMGMQLDLLLTETDV